MPDSVFPVTGSKTEWPALPCDYRTEKSSFKEKGFQNISYGLRIELPGMFICVLGISSFLSGLAGYSD